MTESYTTQFFRSLRAFALAAVAGVFADVGRDFKLMMKGE